MPVRIVLTALSFILSAIFFSGTSAYAQTNSQPGYFLGVGLNDMTPELAQGCGVPAGKGVYVSFVESDSAAQKGGILQGDVITAINGKEMNSALLVQQTIPTAPQKSIVSLLRAGVTYNILVTLQPASQRKNSPTANVSFSDEFPHVAVPQNSGPTGLWVPQNVPPGTVVPIDNFDQIFVNISMVSVANVFISRGGKFDLQVEYTVTDTLEQVGINLPVTLTYAIMQGEKTFLEKTVELQAANAKKNTASKKGITAGKTPGTYVIKITIAYRNKAMVTKSPLVISP